ncbi:hypothetical protein P5673_032141 [Acropora cervicornis]|uniref:Uncharacterized protein n=1 Tax=Acropora cervicornis TaxID=6130 RepID=A0AAD9US29_ACRCE|nr:hypothetical protein P5673_032141 [Acropora cervicornis]
MIKSTYDIESNFSWMGITKAYDATTVQLSSAFGLQTEGLIVPVLVVSGHFPIPRGISNLSTFCMMSVHFAL